MFGTEENKFILLILCRNSASGVADGKPGVSMPLSCNGFIMLTCVTFLAFRLSINVLLMLITSWLLALYAQRALRMANHMFMALQHSYARLWSIV